MILVAVYLHCLSIKISYTFFQHSLQQKTFISKRILGYLMGILGLHFSAEYIEKLSRGIKTATILDGEHNFRIGQELMVYVSDRPNLLRGWFEKRIGKATVKEVIIKMVKDLSDHEAELCGSSNLLQLEKSLKKWYCSEKNSVITLLKFSLQLEE